MMIAIPNHISINSEPVVAASLEGTPLPAGWQAIQQQGLHSSRPMQSWIRYASRLSGTKRWSAICSKSADCGEQWCSTRLQAVSCGLMVRNLCVRRMNLALQWFGAGNWRYSMRVMIPICDVC